MIFVIVIFVKAHLSFRKENHTIFSYFPKKMSKMECTPKKFVLRQMIFIYGKWFEKRIFQDTIFSSLQRSILMINGQFLVLLTAC
jgi:hypothetical protein